MLSPEYAAVAGLAPNAGNSMVSVATPAVTGALPKVTVLPCCGPVVGTTVNVTVPVPLDGETLEVSVIAVPKCTDPVDDDRDTLVADLMSRLTAWVPNPVLASVALMVKAVVPGVLGVPVSAPVAASSVRPAGSVPVSTDQV